MNPGRELDALVAEKVMGEPRPEYIPDLLDDITADESPKGCWRFVWGVWFPDRNENLRRLWFPRPYSTDIATAWKVVEEIRIRFRWLTLYGQSTPMDGGALFEVSIDKTDDVDDPNGWWVCAETAPHAICLAALKAVGVVS